MKNHVQNLEIRVHKADGTVEKFFQIEAGLARQILQDFQPAKVFDSEKIIIADARSLTCFPGRQVVRLDLISEPPVQWIRPPGIMDAVELTKAEFQVLHQNPELRDPRNQVRMLEDSAIHFLEIELTGQPLLFLALELVPEPSFDRPEAVLGPFYPLPTPALCFRMRTGGVAVLNPFHLVCFTLFQAPPLEPGGVWPAQRTNRPQREHRVWQAGEATADPLPPDSFPADGQRKRDLTRRSQNENAPAMEGKY